MARRSKLTPERQDRIVALIRSGNFDYIAAEASGINRATFYTWMAKGEAAQQGMYRNFHDAVKEAQALAEVDKIGIISSAANDGTWQAAAWYLERKHPDRWAAQRGSADNPIHIQHNADALAAAMGQIVADTIGAASEAAASWDPAAGADGEAAE